MKNSLLLILFVIGVNLTYGQPGVAGNPMNGIDKFQLGDSVAKFGSDIRLTPNTPRELRSYQYLPSLKDSLEVGGVPFNIVVLNFDKNDRLERVYFTRFFSEASFLEESKRDYEKLTAYFTEILKRPGEKKVYYAGVHDGYEWTSGDAILSVTLQHTGKRENTSVGVALDRKK